LTDRLIIDLTKQLIDKGSENCDNYDQT